MKTTVTNLTYTLSPNTLPGKGGYHAVLSHVDTTGEDAFYRRVAARRAGLDSATARLSMEAVLAAAADILVERQYRIALADLAFELAIPGSTDGIDGTPSEGAYVVIRPGTALRNAATGIRPVYSAEEDRTEIVSVEDIDTRGTGQIAGTRQFRIGGINLSATGDGEGVKVRAGDGTETVAEIVSEDGTGHHITARLPVVLPPGKGMVTLTTRGWSTPEGELRPITKTVTLLAGDTPPGPTPEEPTFTKVCGTGHEDDPAWTGKVARNGKLSIIGVNLTDDLVVLLLYAGEYEAEFAVDEVTPTMITGSISGGVEPGASYSFALKKPGGTVIGTAEITCDVD